MKIYELDDCPLSERNGMFGGNSGGKEGILFHGERYIVKYPKSARSLKGTGSLSKTTSPQSEYIGSHIYEILGYPVHQTILGIRNDQVVVGCKDLCDNDHQLIEFRQLKNTYNKKLNEELDESLHSTDSGEHFISLEAIRIHLAHNPSIKDVSGLRERFWDCVVVDGLVNNNDRNSGNWGVLRAPGRKDELCPVYDNGSSFSPNIAESKILNKLSNPKNLRNSAINGVTAYTLDGEHSALFRDLIEEDIPELKEAILRNVPLIGEHLDEIVQMISDIPETYRGYDVITAERKSEYKKELEIRYQDLLLNRCQEIVQEQEEEKGVRGKDRSDGNSVPDQGDDGDIGEER